MFSSCCSKSLSRFAFDKDCDETSAMSTISSLSAAAALLTLVVIVILPWPAAAGTSSNLRIADADILYRPLCMCCCRF
jgi:hypothetical protein